MSVSEVNIVKVGCEDEQGWGTLQLDTLDGICCLEATIWAQSLQTTTEYPEELSLGEFKA